MHPTALVYTPPPPPVGIDSACYSWEMSDLQNPERGIPVQLPINLFGRYESQRFRKFEPPYLERELARLAEARIYYGRGNDVPDYGGVERETGMCPVMSCCDNAT